METYVKFEGKTGTSYRVLFDLPSVNGKRRQMQKAGFKTVRKRASSMKTTCITFGVPASS